MLLALLLVASLSDQGQAGEQPPPLLDAATEATPPTSRVVPAPPPPPAPVAATTAEDPATPVVVPPSDEARRTDAAFRAAFGGLVGTAIGWGLGVGLGVAMFSTMSASGDVGELALWAMFYGTPVVVGGFGSFLGALAATRDPFASSVAGAGGAIGVGTTMALGLALFALQPSGECAPTDEQVFVGLATLVATPLGGALGAAAGGYLGASASGSGSGSGAAAE